MAEFPYIRNYFHDTFSGYTKLDVVDKDKLDSIKREIFAFKKGFESLALEYSLCEYERIKGLKYISELGEELLGELEGSVPTSINHPS